MAAPTLGTYLRRLQQAMAAEALAGLSDRDLVDRLRAGPDEPAFRAVLDRHGPMVFQVCRRVLRSAADVEDAFQATFLVLVRRGHTIRRRASLGSWLYGVARRTALKLRTQADRRRRRETRAARPDPDRVSDDTPWGELRGVLDEELDRLPEGCRSALVLCYLEGRTQDEAAAQLAVSKSTLRRHLDRGRDLLGRRLARRGVALGAVLGARLVSDCARGAGMPRALLLRTAASAAPAGAVPARVAALTDGVTKAMHYAKYKTAVAVLACGLAVGVGVDQLAPRPASAQDRARAAEARPPDAAPDIDPIDPNLVFDPEVQKQLRLSPNQVRRLAEARDRGGAATADQGKRAQEIDRRLEVLQKEMEKLYQERAAAQQAVQKAQGDQVKAALPTVLSRDAVQQLRQITVQRMRLSDVLLDPKVRARLDLNDEQVKKIQELAEKGGDSGWLIDSTGLHGSLTLNERNFSTLGLYAHYMVVDRGEPSRAELLKVLTPAQRADLERLSGTPPEAKK